MKPKIERNIEVPLELIKELLTDSEWRMVKQRLLIIKLLEEGLSIRAVAEEAKVGTDTVVRVARKLESSTVLKKLFSRKNQAAQKSKWVFGQVETEE